MTSSFPTHRAAILKKEGEPLSIEQIATPTPGPGEALVRLQTAALNHRDLWIRKGAYGRMTGLPCTLGSDGFGVVEAVGSESDQAWVGRGALLYPGLDW